MWDHWRKVSVALNYKRCEHLTSCTIKKIKVWSLTTRSWNFNLNHHLSGGTFARSKNVARHSVQCENAKPSWVMCNRHTWLESTRLIIKKCEISCSTANDSWVSTSLCTVEKRRSRIHTFVDLQLSRQDLWTYFCVPLQRQGAIKSSPAPSAKQNKLNIKY